MRSTLLPERAAGGGQLAGQLAVQLAVQRASDLLHHLHNLLHHFDKMVQKIVISGNCLQFPEIPVKIREIFTEKSAISADFQQIFEKISKKYSSATRKRVTHRLAKHKGVLHPRDKGADRRV